MLYIDVAHLARQRLPKLAVPQHAQQLAGVIMLAHVRPATQIQNTPLAHVIAFFSTTSPLTI
jgi:hypothetical protein